MFASVIQEAVVPLASEVVLVAAGSSESLFERDTGELDPPTC